MGSSRASRPFEIPARWRFFFFAAVGACANPSEREGRAEHATSAESVAADPLVLRMPIPAGVVALCQQGNESPPSRSHSYPDTQHALDLSTPGARGTPIVAAADGRVIRALVGAWPEAKDPGDGFGNHVVIDHGDGYATLYAHLDLVNVHEGKVIKAGERLGTMGSTGAAGNEHLHFSLHRGQWATTGAPPTVPIERLLTADVSQGDIFEITSSRGMTCADAQVSLEGHLYASENGDTAPTIGAPSDELAAHVEEARAECLDALDSFIPTYSAFPWLVPRPTERGPHAARDSVRALAARTLDDARAHYWVAALSIRDLQDWDSARGALDEIDRRKLPVIEWLVPWILVRRWQIAEHDGATEEAERLAVELSRFRGTQGPELDAFIDHVTSR
ncbi:MAG: M23 family metallopeptidase [Polyangiaceae bacterium]|nr:M23 family metallopeptidase [Polyangiaceae bacterium]